MPLMSQRDFVRFVAQKIATPEPTMPAAEAMSTAPTPESASITTTNPYAIPFAAIEAAALSVMEGSRWKPSIAFKVSGSTRETRMEASTMHEITMNARPNRLMSGLPAPATKRKSGVANAPPTAIDIAVHFGTIMLKSTVHTSESESSPAPSSTQTAIAQGMRRPSGTSPAQLAPARRNAGANRSSEPGSTKGRILLNTKSGNLEQNARHASITTRETIRHRMAISIGSKDKSGSAGENTI